MILSALAGGKPMGEVDLRGDRLSSQYEPAWQSSDSAFPLSLSMPLVATEHGHRVVEAILWGLLPDNAGVLERWGRSFRVSPRNPLRILEHDEQRCRRFRQRPKFTTGRLRKFHLDFF
jgi:serine/threonine-protein kinase HipA